MRSKALQSYRALVVSFLLSLFAMQVFAISTMPLSPNLKTSSVSYESGYSEHAHFSELVTAQTDFLSDAGHNGHMSDQECDADHCLITSVITLGDLRFEFPRSESEIASVNVSADSIDINPPSYPPITG